MEAKGSQLVMHSIKRLETCWLDERYRCSRALLPLKRSEQPLMPIHLGVAPLSSSEVTLIRQLHRATVDLTTGGRALFFQ